MRARVVQGAAPDAAGVLPAGVRAALVEDRDAVGGQRVLVGLERVGLGLVGAAQQLDLVRAVGARREHHRGAPDAARRRARQVLPAQPRPLAGRREPPGVDRPRARHQARARSASRTGAGSSRRPAACRRCRARQRAQLRDAAAAAARARRREQVEVLVLVAVAALVEPAHDHRAAVGHQQVGRVPAPVRHVGLARPALAERVEGVDVVEAGELAAGRLDRVHRLPPVTSTRPSVSSDWPLHQMFTGCPVFGSIGGLTRLNEPGPVPFEGSQSTATARWRAERPVGVARDRVPEHLAGRQHHGVGGEGGRAVGRADVEVAGVGPAPRPVERAAGGEPGALARGDRGRPADRPAPARVALVGPQAGVLGGVLGPERGGLLLAQQRARTATWRGLARGARPERAVRRDGPARTRRPISRSAAASTAGARRTRAIQRR